MSSAHPGEKTKEERVREGISLLRQLQDIGVDPADPQYIMLKDRVSDWVKTGDPWAGKIPFTSYGRVAEVLLPRKAAAAASLAFRTKA